MKIHSNVISISSFHLFIWYIENRFLVNINTFHCYVGSKTFFTPLFRFYQRIFDVACKFSNNIAYEYIV